jgi:hypothetical protein
VLGGSVGAGLHVAAHYLERETTLSDTGTVVPVAVYTLTLYGLCASFTCHRDPFHLSLLAGTEAVLVLTVVLAASGVSVAICLVALMFAPIVTVVGYETVGHRRLAEALAHMRDPRA